MRQRARTLGLVVLSCALASPAWSAGVAPLPMGPRTGPMGGAGVARGDDSAMGYLNPAGLARVPRDTLSMSLSAYALNAVRIERFFADPGSDLLAGFDLHGNELKQQSFVAIPTALAYVFHVGSDHVLALSLLTPRGTDVDLSGSMNVDSATLRFDDRVTSVSSARTYDLGPSWAATFGAGDVRLRVGASAFVAYSTLAQTLAMETLSGAIPPTEFAQIELQRHTTAWSMELAPVVGAQLDLGVFSVGVSFHAPSLHLTGSVEGTARQTQLANGAFDQLPETLLITREAGEYEERQPMRLLVGVALELADVTIAVDGGLTFGVGPYTLFDSELESSTLTEGQAPVNETVRQRTEYSNDTVVNAALGIEYRISEHLALRAGGFTDLSNEKLPSSPSAREVLLSRIDRFGGTLGLAFGGGAGATSLAVLFIGGTGETIGLDVGNSQSSGGARRVDALTTTIAVMASGTVDVQSMLGP